jgi:glycosyltransferase, family 8
MYIMRKEIFDRYAAWVFPLVDEWTARTDMSTYSKEALRTPGHLTERLFNIWRMHMLRTEGKDWKVKELQCIHFTNPEPRQKFTPLFEEKTEIARQDVVPVVFAADNNYAPILTCAIGSMLENADPSRYYDVVVLNTNIGGSKQDLVKQHFSRYKNARITFYNVWRMVKDYKLDTNNAHISVETYFRFLAQDILSAYDKVVYLDSDLVVNGNVAELFDVKMGDNLIAATLDIDYLANLNIRGGDRMKYSLDVLNLKNPYAYFQAGVMVFNTAELRRYHTVPEWLRIASNPIFIYNDQDILNSECQGRVVYLPADWNVTHNIFGRAEKLYPLAPNSVFDDYQAARRAPKVVHFAGAIKPWQNASCDMASYFWKYARNTPFYEVIIQDMVPGARNDADVTEFHERALSDASPLRKIIDPLAPYGSARREALKALGRTLRGRK